MHYNSNLPKYVIEMCERLFIGDKRMKNVINCQIFFDKTCLASVNASTAYLFIMLFHLGILR